MSNVLIDYIGSVDLFYSLYLLFEKRLGMKVYRPLGGRDWQDACVYTDTSVAGQIGVPKRIDGYTQLRVEMEPGKEFEQRLITFSEFLSMDFDVIVVTTYQNEEPFKKIIRDFQLPVKFIRQIANVEETPICCKNVLLSTLTPMPEGINYRIYYPESYEGYSYTPPRCHNLISSFSNYLPSYPEDLKEWLHYRSQLEPLGFVFRMHGIDGYDGFIPHVQMPEAIRGSAFVWHTKGVGGGGFILRQALAAGRPCIVRRRYCEWYNTLAKNLLHDGLNCIDLDQRTRAENIKLIKEWAAPERHEEVCKTVAQVFKDDVNFDKQADEIRNWLNEIENEEA